MTCQTLNKYSKITLAASSSSPCFLACSNVFRLVQRCQHCACGTQPRRKTWFDANESHCAVCKLLLGWRFLSWTRTGAVTLQTAHCQADITASQQVSAAVLSVLKLQHRQLKYWEREITALPCISQILLFVPEFVSFVYDLGREFYFCSSSSSFLTFLFYNLRDNSDLKNTFPNILFVYYMNV